MTRHHLVGQDPRKGRRTDDGELPVEVPEELLVLTDKQRKFCEIYVNKHGDLTLTEMSREAGYNYNAGPTLLRHGPAMSYIKKLRQEIALKYEVTFETHVRKLAEIRDIALQNGAYAAAVTAEKSRGQVAGLYIDRKEILHGRLDQMSKDDVLKEIEKLKEEFPGLSAIFETNKVIEHIPAEQRENDKEAGEQVQQATGDSNKG